MLKFTCDRIEFINALSTASRTVSTKSSIAALEGIYISAGVLLTMTGYNLETGISVSMEADVSEMGSAVFPARLLGEIVRKMPEESISIEVDDEYKVVLRSGRSNFRIMASPADDYPALPDVEFDKAIYVPQNIMKDMINGTIFAVSDNQSRPIQTGCKFEISGDSFIMVAVDGYRLGLRKENIDNPEGRELSFVCPGTSLKELEKILTDTDEDCSFTIGTRHIMFSIGSTTLICRLLEGEFLNWRNVVPRDNPVKLSFNVKEMLSMIERISLIINEKMKSPVRMKFQSNLVSARTTTAQGNAYDEMSMAGEGGDMEIGFNNHYMMDALRAIPTEEAILELKSKLSPAVITPAEGEKYLYMVLPVRLRDE